MTEQKTFKRMTDGKIVLEDVIYDSSFGKRSMITNPNTGNRIDSIKIGETSYYPVGQVKKKNTATNVS
jgi:hypothetical protein